MNSNNDEGTPHQSSWKVRDIKDWDTNNLVNWILSLDSKILSEKWKNLIIEPIKENNSTGQDIFALKSGTELKESLDIKNKIACNRLMDSFKTLKVKRRDAAIAQAAANNPTDDTDIKVDEYKSFTLHMCAQGKMMELDQRVTLKTKVSEIKFWYKEQTGVKSKLEDIEMYKGGKPMDPNKTLGECKVIPDAHLIHVKFDAHGGAKPAAIDIDDDPNRERTIKFDKYQDLVKSKQKDCLIHYDDNDGIDRAEIGCSDGHAMAASTMYKYIEQVLEKNMKSVTIPCPICHVVLDWDKCTQIADMNGREYAKWTRVIEFRIGTGKTRPCPNCAADCQRKKGVVIFRMFCTACKGTDWCWVCGKKWKGNGLTWCNNKDCKLITETNAIMANAETITPEYLKKAKIPNIRACPMCLTLIKHKDQCKHMTCPGCNGDFCFVCLAIKNKETNKWPCATYTDECPPAPKQVFT